MKRIASCAVVALAVFAGSHRASGANMLANPGFESPITFDGAPFVGSWEGFSGAPGASAANSTLQHRSGTQSLQLSIVNTDNTFAGAFQDVTGLVPGTVMSFTGYNLSNSNPLDLTVEVRIEWRNNGTSSEVSRTPNLNPVPTGTFQPFAVTAAVPAGADTARLVYAIQTFSSEPTNTGTVYVDDVSFDVVPEPASAAVLCAGAVLSLMPRRRRGSR